MKLKTERYSLKDNLPYCWTLRSALNRSGLLSKDARNDIGIVDTYGNVSWLPNYMSAKSIEYKIEMCLMI